MSTPRAPLCTNAQCHKRMRWINETWQCPKCSPCAKTIETIARRIANGFGYRNHASNCNKVRRPHAAPEPPKAPWQPSWAGKLQEPDQRDLEAVKAYNARLAIVAAVREARAAQRRLSTK